MRKLACIVVGAATVALISGCDNAETNAVKNVLGFAESAPYSLNIEVAPAKMFREFVVAVDDSALAQYNRIFQYFEPQDSTRSRLYRDTPAELLWTLPVLDVTSVSEERAGDTTIVTAVFKRPDPRLFEASLSPYERLMDSVPPIDSVRRAFKESLAHARHELPTVDTARFWVVAGPRIVRMRTATQVRDSVARAVKEHKVRAQLDSLVHLARLTHLKVEDYPYLSAYTGRPEGGTITGYLNPVGVEIDGGTYAMLNVQCEARRGTNSTFESGYISIPELRYTKRKDFICMWNADEAVEWQDVNPVEFRVRLVATMGPDSIVGPWVDIHR